MFKDLKKALVYNFKISIILPAKELLDRSKSRITGSKEELLKHQIEALNSMFRNKIEQGETAITADVTPIMSLVLNDIKEKYEKEGYVVVIIGEDIKIEGLPEDAKYIWISLKKNPSKPYI